MGEIMILKQKTYISMMQHIKTYAFISCLFITPTVAADAEWTILVYVQANNNLADYAEKNFSDMASIGSSDKLNILVEWHQPKKQGAWRYKIDKNKMTFDACVSPESDGNDPQDLVNAMQWAVSQYPAKKYSLVLWNHGIGVIDPLWGKYHPWNGNSIINPKVVKENPRIQIEGITTHPSKKSHKKNNSKKIKHEDTRGILFNDQTRTYMTNQQLTQALASIKEHVLKGKKINILGMDACLMAMVEIGYQTKDYVDILVASEEVELAHGWSYSSFLQGIKNTITTPEQLAQSIVLTYEKYYKNRVQFFTQSAINLDKMDLVKESLDLVVYHTKQCKDAKINIDQAIKKARNSCQQFSAQNYVDLHSFLTEYYTQVNSLPTSTKITDLKNAIHAGIKIVETSVLAYTAGQYLKRAKGLSIYYPTGHIDASYARTDFAQQSLWLCLLNDFNVR